MGFSYATQEQPSYAPISLPPYICLRHAGESRALTNVVCGGVIECKGAAVVMKTKALASLRKSKGCRQWRGGNPHTIGSLPHPQKLALPPSPTPSRCAATPIQCVIKSVFILVLKSEPFIFFYFPQSHVFLLVSFVTQS